MLSPQSVATKIARRESPCHPAGNALAAPGLWPQSRNRSPKAPGTAPLHSPGM